MNLKDFGPAVIWNAVLCAAFFGLIMGSFLNCTAWRFTHKEKITKGRSHCAVCGHELSPLDLIPLFSWIFLKGRCRYCKEKISIRYPLTELICAVCYASIVYTWGFSWDSLKFIILASILLVISLVDIEQSWIPDSLLIIGTIAFVLITIVSGGDVIGKTLNGLIGLSALLIPMLLLVLAADKIAGRETMGGGDIKLIGLLGMYFGWMQGLFLLIIACFIGIFFALATGKLKNDKCFPFGPALSIAAWFTILFGTQIISKYLSLFIY